MTRLAVKSLAVSHFRSHKQSLLELDGRPVAIFGPNGAGKTNLLEAVSLLSPGRGLRRASAAEMGRQPDALGWKIRAELDSLTRIHELATWSEDGAARSVTIDDKSSAQLALGRICRIVWLIPSMDRLWTEGAEGRRRFLDRMVLSFTPSHGEVVLAYDKAMRERNRLLKDQIDDTAWFTALERQMAQAGHRIDQNRRETLDRIAVSQQGAETRFPAASLSLESGDGDSLPQTMEDLETAFRDGRKRDMAAGRTLIGPHRSDLSAIYAAKGVPAKFCSTGEQKALLISLILSNARALAEDFGAPPLLLLDEVAAHLDSGRRAALYDEMLALGAQAWMTGTGPELFSELGERVQGFLTTEVGGVSRVDPTGPGLG